MGDQGRTHLNNPSSEVALAPTEQPQRSRDGAGVFPGHLTDWSPTVHQELMNHSPIQCETSTSTPNWRAATQHGGRTKGLAARSLWGS